MTNTTPSVIHSFENSAFAVRTEPRFHPVKKASTIVVQRCEKKYAIGMEDRIRLLEAFNVLLTPDIYGGKFGYIVRSIYFDSINNNDYLNKIYKASERKNIRIRTYNADSPIAKFEIKFKRGDNQVKKSITISKEDALAMINRDFSVLLKYENPTAQYGYKIMKAGLYRPVSFIQYDRRAFTHRDFNTRITLDNHVLYSNHSFNLYNPDLDLCTPILSNNTVLEVKYEKYLLPYLQDMILGCEHLGKPISKFGTSRKIVTSYYC
ncbi:MAG TPA: polyphosphate polymerase domain-containing protein [Bacillota bacterium]|nr:polyphosphate polymerase domain-containing protein [Bacillota bacterium]